MKKFLCVAAFLLASLFCILPVTHAETADPIENGITEMLKSGMTLSEIVIWAESQPEFEDSISQVGTNTISFIHLLLERELQRRSFRESEVAVSSGTYVIGEDIPAGEYTITASTAGMIFVQTLSASGESLDYFMLYTIYGDEYKGKIGKLSLNVGETIKINGGTVIFSTYKGLGF